MDGGIALLVLLALVVVGGSIAGIIALFQLSSLKREVVALRVKLNATYVNNSQTNTANKWIFAVSNLDSGFGGHRTRREAFNLSWIC